VSYVLLKTLLFNFNNIIMRRLLFASVIMALTLSGFGQKSVDALFNRYAGNDGFVTVTISGNLLKLAKALCDDDEKDDNCWPSDITTIRILIQEDEGMKTGNFYDLVERDLDRKSYEEFMRVKESDQDLVMLVRTAGRSFKEFLVIAGGEDNLLIQVKGNMTFREAEKFSEKIKKDNGAGFVLN
jgi:Domain of unknown function (DUF4252)